MKTFIFEHISGAMLLLAEDSYDEAEYYFKSITKEPEDWKCEDKDGNTVLEHIKEHPDNLFAPGHKIETSDALSISDSINTHPVLQDAIEGLKEANNTTFCCMVCNKFNHYSEKERCMNHETMGRQIENPGEQPSWCKLKGTIV